MFGDCFENKRPVQNLDIGNLKMCVSNLQKSNWQIKKQPYGAISNNSQTDNKNQDNTTLAKG